MPTDSRSTLVASPRNTRRRDAIRLGAAAVAIVATTGTILLAQPQPTPDDKGKARVVERRGPEVDVRANGGGQIVVLFPHAAQGAGGGGKVVELTMVESQLPPAAAPGQQAAPQTATPTGKEYVFNSRDARDQTVSYKLDANGNARKLMLLAKIDGKVVEVRAAGGPEGVQVYTIPMPEVPKPQQQQQPQQQPQQTGGTEGGDAAAQAAAAAAAAPAAPAAPPAPPAQAAVIILYSGAIAQQ